MKNKREILLNFLNKIKNIKEILLEINKIGGVCYLVGGSVRDLVLGRQIKDLDIEVHKISLDDLEECLKKFGNVSLVGKQFGVFKLFGRKSEPEVDWSLPRKDSVGRKPLVVVDKDLTIEQASRRRDVTMNSMAIDLSFVFDSAKGFNIIDNYNGLEDIKNKVLRVVDKDFFIQDPLRFYRVMQFVSRFEMYPDDQLNEICKQIDLRDVAQGGELARERIYEEIKKLFLKSQRPSLGFRWVKDIGRLDELFPELGATVDIEQREDYHPEGDVFEHTMQCIDVPVPKEFDEEEKFMLMLGILCHDFGKVKKIEKNGKARGHDVAGVPITKTFLRRFTWNSNLIRAVCKLVRYHRMPVVLVEQESSLKAYKRLAIKLAPEITTEQLHFVSWVDVRGRNKYGTEPLENGFANNDKILETFLQKVRQAKVEAGPEKPILQGRDLLDVVEPGPKMGELLKKAYEIQIDEGIKDVEELKKRVLG